MTALRRPLTHSIKSRFAASLLANGFRSLLVFATGLLLARWMGPQDYGRFVFLMASFMAFRQLLDMGASSAFFTFLSRRTRSRNFVLLFWRWVILQFLVSLALVALILPGSTLSAIWLGESRGLLVLALVATFMQGTVWNIASQMAEASRETIRLQRLNSLVVLIHFGVVLALWWLERLALPLIFLALIIEWSIAGWLAARMYRRQDSGSGDAGGSADTAGTVWREFLPYCLPMIPYTWLGFAHDFADRWMLQQWGGAAEQAYYGVAQQFAGVALLATTSIMRIFWKEISEAHHQGDTEKVKHLYDKVSKLLYFVSASMAGAAIPWAGDILQITVGDAYRSGVVTFMLMLFYPVMQSMGQICGTMLYATGQTKVQSVLGMIFMLISMLTAYFVLAPADAVVPGWGMASQGMAWKMVLLAFIQVNVLAWYIARKFGWNFLWYYQIGTLLICLVNGWLSWLIVSPVFGDLVPVLLQMSMSMVLFLAGVMVSLQVMPGLAGMSHREWQEYRQHFLAIFRKA